VKDGVDEGVIEGGMTVGIGELEVLVLREGMIE
jgi:hypothetical protein